MLGIKPSQIHFLINTIVLNRLGSLQKMSKGVVDQNRVCLNRFFVEYFICNRNIRNDVRNVKDNDLGASA